MRFIGFLTKHFHQTTNTLADVKSAEQNRNGTDDVYKNRKEGTLSGHSSESGIDEDIHPGSEHLQGTVFSDEGSLHKSRKCQGKVYLYYNQSNAKLTFTAI